jgi:hypothetical protein
MVYKELREVSIVMGIPQNEEFDKCEWTIMEHPFING